MDERVRRVMGLIHAARRIARDPGDLVERLVRSTGLSREGVLLGLHEHLETDATEEDAQRLVERTPAASRVHVVLSSNVFVGALRALAVAAAASPNVTVRPSSREPHFALALASADVLLATDTRVADVREGEIHVYGRDETVQEVRRSARDGVVVRGHGSGMGVAVVKGDLERSARALAKDVVAFDQRGCLSPRLCFVLLEPRSFAEALFAELSVLEESVPRGTLSPDEAALAETYASIVAFAGTLFRASSHAVGVATSVILPPPGRHLHVVAVKSEAEITSAMQPIAKHVVAIGVGDLLAPRPWAPPHARVSALGRMQRPPLDGPVDLRGSAPSVRTV